MSDTINVSVGTPGVVYPPKQRVIYILIAILVPLFSPCFCGLIPPLHNFYAGHNSKGLTQLAIWLGAWAISMFLDFVLGTITLGISSIVGIVLASVTYLGVFIWCIVDAVTVTTDGNGVPMQ